MVSKRAGIAIGVAAAVLIVCALVFLPARARQDMGPTSNPPQGPTSNPPARVTGSANGAYMIRVELPKYSVQDHQILDRLHDKYDDILK